MDIDWLGDLDFGNVPEWFSAAGAVSLILAWRVFRRDQENSDRTQIDRVGAWAQVIHEHRDPTADRVEAGTVKAFVRNGSELPVRLVKMHVRVTSKWFVPDSPAGRIPSWTVHEGTDSHSVFMEPVRVPPGDVQEWSLDVNMAHTAPKGAVQLAWSRGLEAHVDWMLLIDNAGRRWEVRPEKGARAKRVGRRWRPDQHMPKDWD